MLWPSSVIMRSINMLNLSRPCTGRKAPVCFWALRHWMDGFVSLCFSQVNISQMSTTPEAKGHSHKASTPSTEDDKSFFADVSAIAHIGQYQGVFVRVHGTGKIGVISGLWFCMAFLGEGRSSCLDFSLNYTLLQKKPKFLKVAFLFEKIVCHWTWDHTSFPLCSW